MPKDYLLERQTKKTAPIYQEENQTRSQLWRNSRPWCEGIRPQSDVDFQTSAVHSCEQLYTPGMVMKTQIRKLFRIVHSCARFPVIRAKYENEKTKQKSLELLKYSHRGCDDIRPECDADLQTSVVHSCEKIDTPGVKTTNPKT